MMRAPAAKPANSSTNRDSLVLLPGRHSTGAAILTLVLAIAGCASSMPDGGPDTGIAADGGPGDAGQSDTTTCAPPPPNYPICPAAPCHDASQPGCAGACLARACYACLPGGSWQTEAVDCPVGDAGPAPDQGPSLACREDRDCPAGQICGYPVVDRCSAAGVCVVGNCAGTACLAPGGLCGCDGQPVEPVRVTFASQSFKIEYTSRPLESVGPCSFPDAGPFSGDVPTLLIDAAPDAPADGLAAPDAAAAVMPGPCDGILPGSGLVAVVEATGVGSGVPTVGSGGCEGDVGYSAHVERTLCGSVRPTINVVANALGPFVSQPLAPGERGILLLTSYACHAYRPEDMVMDVEGRYPVSEWDRLAGMLRHPDAGP
jgi:hypothetical protein